MEPLSADDPRMIGEFRLHSRLGAGGMGQVYLGFSPAGRAVAIKVIHGQFAADPEFLRRFSHEVTAARAVGGMYTAPVVDSSVTDKPPWLATAYVPGPPLSAIVARHGALPEPAVWRLAAGLAEALRAVHAAGVIHRDLKPANVLLADDGPHLIDFGISRPFHGTQLTSAGMVIGTPGYMSPEQAETGPAGPASDVFSLGCVLAYAATGSAPFGGENPASVLFRIMAAEPDLTAVPPSLRQVIEACLRKEPGQRPEPARLISMINSLGPETPATLGSFWPPQVARVIAAEQSAQTPAGLTPPGTAASSRAATGRPSGATGVASPPVERTPTALAAPAGQGGGATGHAPMLSDGYYAAAAQGRAGPATPTPSASASGSQGRTVFGQPGLPAPGAYAASAAPPAPFPGGRYPRQSGSYPQQGGSYPGQGGSYPGQQDALAGYAPARRKPTAAEIPGKVHTAIRLMYVGFVVTALDVVLSLVAVGRYAHAANVAKTAAARLSALGEPTRAANQTAITHTQNTMAGAMAIGLIADILGLACWAWLAVATRRGNDWTRVAGTVLLAIYGVCALFVVFGTHNDPGARFTTVAGLAIGVAAVVPLWSQQARDFFFAWRKR
jgi:hypothetical protein